MACDLRLSLAPTLSCAVSAASPTRRFRRFVSSSMTTRSSLRSAGFNSESASNAVTEALIEVSGVRSSCVTQSSKTVRKSLPSLDPSQRSRSVDSLLMVGRHSESQGIAFQVPEQRMPKALNYNALETPSESVTEFAAITATIASTLSRLGIPVEGFDYSRQYRVNQKLGPIWVQILPN